jgi:hypothetical protein
MGAYIPLDRNGTRVPGLEAFGNSEHDFRDKHASQFTTGRFVLLPKNLVTGAAKARIVSRATCTGSRPSGRLTLKPRLSRGFFLAKANPWTLNASTLPSGPPEYHFAYRDPAQRPCTPHRDVSKEGATGCPAGGDLAYGLSRLRTRHTPGHAAAWARRV